MITIGLCGSIAAGKSEVSRLLADLGATIVDADRIAHEAYAPGTDGIDQLTAAFGPDILGEDGSVDRGKLGSAVFGDQAKLAQLSAIVWPLTRRLVEQRKAEAKAAGAEVFVIEAPLLVEAGWLDLVDYLWFVKTTPEVALQRLLSRGHSEADARSRLAARPAIERAEAASDVVIENSGSIDALSERVNQLWNLLHNEAR